MSALIPFLLGGVFGSIVTSLFWQAQLKRTFRKPLKWTSAPIDEKEVLE